MQIVRLTRIEGLSDVFETPINEFSRKIELFMF